MTDDEVHLSPLFGVGGGPTNSVEMKDGTLVVLRILSESQEAAKGARWRNTTVSLLSNRNAVEAQRQFGDGEKVTGLISTPHANHTSSHRLLLSSSWLPQTGDQCRNLRSASVAVHTTGGDVVLSNQSSRLVTNASEVEPESGGDGGEGVSSATFVEDFRRVAADVRSVASLPSSSDRDVRENERVSGGDEEAKAAYYDACERASERIETFGVANVAALLSTHADTLQHLKGKGNDGGQGAAGARLVGALLSRAKSLLAGCDGQELTDVLTAVAAVRDTPSDAFLCEAMECLTRLDGRRALSREQLVGCLGAFAIVTPGSCLSELSHMLGVLQHSVARVSDHLTPSEMLLVANLFVQVSTHSPDDPSFLSKPVKALRASLASRSSSLSLPEACEVIRIFDDAPRGGLGERLESAIEGRLASVIDNSPDDLSLPSIALALHSLAAARHVPPPPLFAQMESVFASLAMSAEGSGPSHDDVVRPMDVVCAARGAAMLLGERAAGALTSLEVVWSKRCRPLRERAPPYEVATLSWAFAVGGTLTPRSLRRLTSHLTYRSEKSIDSEGSRERAERDGIRLRRGVRLTDAQACKLFQSEMALASSSSPVLPAALHDLGRSVWLRQVAGAIPSALAKMVATELRAIGVKELATEALTDDGLLAVDLAIGAGGEAPLAVEVHGPTHYARNRGRVGHELGPSLLRRRLLEARGWRVVVVHGHQLQQLSADRRRRWLRAHLLSELDNRHTDRAN